MRHIFPLVFALKVDQTQDRAMKKGAKARESRVRLAIVRTSFEAVTYLCFSCMTE
jgi:hypothetical protein